MTQDYDVAKAAVKGIGSSSKAYEGVRAYADAREEAAKFAESQGNQVEADSYRDPSTPIETVSGALAGFNQIHALRLQDKVENNLEGILGGVDERKLAGSLKDYFSKPGADYAEAHDATRNLFLIVNSENADPRDVEKAFSNAIKAIKKYYESKYSAEEGDNEYVAKEKGILKSIFLSLYAGGNEKITASKYDEITKKIRKELSDELSEKPQLVRHVMDTLPEDLPSRTQYVSSLLAA